MKKSFSLQLLAYLLCFFCLSACNNSSNEKLITAENEKLKTELQELKEKEKIKFALEEKERKTEELKRLEEKELLIAKENDIGCGNYGVHDEEIESGQVEQSTNHTDFSESYSEWMVGESRISVKFNGSNMTVKWTNSENGVTTKITICEPYRTTVQIGGKYSYIEKERKCNCTDESGNYFIFTNSNGTYSIGYYNELDDKRWSKMLNQD